MHEPDNRMLCTAGRKREEGDSLLRMSVLCRALHDLLEKGVRAQPIHLHSHLRLKAYDLLPRVPPYISLLR